MWGFNIGFAKLFEYPMREMAVNKHFLNRSLKQQDKISSSRRISTCSLILFCKLCHWNCRKPGCNIWRRQTPNLFDCLLNLLTVCCSQHYGFPDSCMPTVWPDSCEAAGALWPLLIPLSGVTATTDLRTCLLEWLACFLLGEHCWGVVLGLGFLAHCASEAQSSSSGVGST